MNFSKAIKMQPVLDYASAASSRNSDIVDTLGFDGVCFVVHLAAIASGGTNSLKVQQGADSALGDAADLLGTSVTIADDDDNEVKFIDVPCPRERYLRLVVTKDSSHACAESAIAYLYNAKNQPVTHATDVAGEIHHAPAEGTA